MPSSPRVVLELHVEQGRYAVELDAVIEVSPRVNTALLPGTSPPIVGLVRHRGGIAVAVDLRVRFGHSPRAPSLDDHFVFVQTKRRRIALVVDRAIGVREIDLERVQPPPVAAEYVRGTIPLEDGLLLLHDVDRALSLDEERALDVALAAVDEASPSELAVSCHQRPR